MKTNKLFFLVTAIALLSLAGCQANETSLTSETQAPSYSEADTTAYKAATASQDTSFCKKIEDVKYQQECTTTVANQIAFENAITQKDTKLCSEISSMDKQKACAIQIEYALGEEKKLQAKQTTRQNQQSKMNDIISSNDYTRCKELTEENYKYSCEQTILTNQAISTKDLTWCDKASNAELQSACKAEAK